MTLGVFIKILKGDGKDFEIKKNLFEDKKKLESKKI